MKKRVLLSLLFMLLWLSPVLASPVQQRGAASSAGSETRICLELMDLEAPEGAGQQEMQLPPLKGEEEKPPAVPPPPKSAPAPLGESAAIPKSAAEPAAAPAPRAGAVAVPAPQVGSAGVPVPPAGGAAAAVPLPESAGLRPLEVEGAAGPASKAEVGLPPLKMPAVREETVAVPAPAPEISPMFLPPSAATAEKAPPALKTLEPGTGQAGEAGIATGELKTLAPPSKELSLKVPATVGSSAPASSAPELPKLAGEGEAPALRTPEAPLPVKPVLKGVTSVAAQEVTQPQAEAQGATAPDREAIDRKLIEIYDRFYKNL